MLRVANGSKRQSLAAPQSPSAELATLERACEALAHCDCMETVMSFIDRAEAVRHFARSAKMGLKLVNKAAESKMRAERRLGQLLAEMDLRGGDHVSDLHHMRVTLKELGISQNQSTRCQKEAEVPEEEFGKLVEMAREYEFEFTTATLLRLATKLRKKREVNATGQHRSPRRRSATSSPVEIIAELEDHCAVFDGILSIVYDTAGPVDLHFGQRKHLRRLIREFKSLLDDLKEHAVGQDSAAATTAQFGASYR